MSFWDSLLGRFRPAKPVTDPLFALSTAWVSFGSETGYHPAGSAGIVLRPATSQQFSETQQRIRELLELMGGETGSKIQMQSDPYGYLWLLFRDPDWEDMVALVHMAGTSITEEGYGEQLLAAVFRLQQAGNGKTLFLIYGYKRGRFYPFIPRQAKEQERDQPEEMRVYALLENELPWEKDLQRWYPLWDCPV